MKRPRRIEVVRYTSQITLSREGGAPHRAEGPDIDVLLDALGDSVPAPEELRHEIHADAVAQPRRPLMRRLLRLPPETIGISPIGKSANRMRRLGESLGWRLWITLKVHCHKLLAEIPETDKNERGRR